MRVRWIAAAVVSVALLTWGGVAGAAPGAAAAKSPAAGPAPVVIDAASAQAAGMATQPGPNGTPIPVDACGALVNGAAWVLPCTDPRVLATDQTRLPVADHGGWSNWELRAGGLVAAAGFGVVGVVAVRRRRQGTAWAKAGGSRGH